MRLRRRLVEPLVLCGLVAQAVLGPLTGAPLAADAAPAVSRALSHPHPRAALGRTGSLPLPVATTTATLIATPGTTDVPSNATAG